MIQFRAVLHASGILSGKHGEIGVRFDDFLSVRNHQLSVVVEEPIQHLEYFRRRKIQLIKDNPMTFSHGSDKRAFLENKVSHGVTDVCAKVFLDVRVCVVVDANKLVACAKSKILH